MSAEAAEKIDLSVVIPAFNEREGIGAVVAGVRSVLEGAAAKSVGRFEILVIDDGSDDGTGDLAEKAGARVLRHPINMGYGRSLVTGFDNAAYDWVLTTDADGSYPDKEIADILSGADGFDMVVGAREGSLFWGSPLRSFMRRAYLFMAGFVAGFNVPDANSGLRLVRKSAMVSSMPIICYGYSFSTTMTLSFIQAGRFVKFHPIPYLARKGHSKVSMVRDVLRTLQLMVQVILYYNPLKFAVLLAAFPAVLAAAFAARWACGHAFGHLALATACLLSALFVFLIGCVLDQQRLHRK